MRFLLDTSVLVPLFVADALSGRAESWLAPQEPGLLVSDCAAAEFASALARQHWERRLDRAEAAFVAFNRWVSSMARRIPMASEDAPYAEAVIRALEHPLRSLDALHLAAAHRLGAVLVTFDRQLARAASALGLQVAPA